MIDGHQLGDESAHRCADHVRGSDAQGVEQADAVVGHVVERVSRLSTARERCHHIRLAGAFHLRRETDVSVVVANDMETAGGELLAEVLFPADHLGTEAHHEQERRVLWIPKRLELDVDPVGSRSWHEPIL